MQQDNPHYVTLEEADRMGCPMSMNRPEFAAACIGKECMAWRWKQVASKAIFYTPHPAKPVPDSNWILEERISETVGLYKEGPTHGYCGMVRS